MKRLIKEKYSKETLQKIYDFVINKNKFNFKTAEIDKNTIRNVCNKVEDLVDFNEPGSILEIKNILKEQCPNCIYSGTVYRKFIFRQRMFEVLDKTTLNNRIYFKVKDVNDLIHKEIRTGTYQSCSKDLEACKNFDPEESGVEVIIKFEGSDGIDIMEVCKFYKNVCEEEYKKNEDQFYESLIERFTAIIREFEKEKEVLTKVNENYEIFFINNTPYSEDEEYILINNVLLGYIDENEDEDEENYDDGYNESENGYGTSI